MKKRLYLLPTLAIGLSLASCSNEDVKTGASSTDEDDYATNYLSVNLVQAPDMASRADEIYEDGDVTENTVSKVRFYFFDVDGKAVDVKKVDNVYQNFYDWENGIDSDGKESPNVEKKLKAVLIINTKEGDKLPAKVLAVLNPDKLNLDNSNLNLSDFQADTKAYNFAEYANASGTDKTFIMVNSVYADNQNSEIVATEIPVSFYANTMDGAKANPVNIYVERNVAKIRVTLKEGIQNVKDKDGKDLIKLTFKDESGKPQDLIVDDKQVYLKLGQWNVTADTDKGNLIKDIDIENWQATGSSLFSEWNKPEFFRSYWATNATKAQQQWHNYYDIASNNGKGYYNSDNMLANSLYVNENAPYLPYTNNEASFTKIILAGELGTLDNDDTFTPVTITKFSGITSIGEDNLIMTLLSSMGTNMIYTEKDRQYVNLQYSTEPGGEKDVKLVTAITAKQASAGESTTGRYYVYLALSETGAGKTWSKNNTADDFEAGKFANESAVNNYLASTPGKAQVYKGGLTYYYFPIEHLGDTGEIGEYGVVRNHIYDCRITEITGLGTPVYDPTEDIYPEKPVDDETFIAAQINILSWRLVQQNIGLNW